MPLGVCTGPRSPQPGSHHPPLFLAGGEKRRLHWLATVGGLQGTCQALEVSPTNSYGAPIE
jgi:hypothetical protein